MYARRRVRRGSICLNKYNGGNPPKKEPSLFIEKQNKNNNVF